MTIYHTARFVYVYYIKNKFYRRELPGSSSTFLHRVMINLGL